MHYHQKSLHMLELVYKGHQVRNFIDYGSECESSTILNVARHAIFGTNSSSDEHDCD